MTLVEEDPLNSTEEVEEVLVLLIEGDRINVDRENGKVNVLSTEGDLRNRAKGAWGQKKIDPKSGYERER